LIARWVWWW